MISAIVLTKNEEQNIVACLTALKWCDEILVIDDHSTDDTVSLAKKHGAKVISHGLADNFSHQRNFAMEHATNEWIFFVDADERVPKPLAQEIQKRIQDPEVTGYYVPRIDYMWGKFLKHGETGDVELLRLLKKKSGKWAGRVHEVFVTLGKTELLSHPLEHYPHLTISEFLREINFYSTLRAQELFEQGKKANWISIIAYPKGKFLKNYILKLGFLDGTAGLVLAVLMSLHSFLVRGKLWQLWQNSSNHQPS